MIVPKGKGHVMALRKGLGQVTVSQTFKEEREVTVQIYEGKAGRTTTTKALVGACLESSRNSKEACIAGTK